MKKKIKHWFVIYSTKERGLSFQESRGIVRAEDAWEAYNIAEEHTKRKEGVWVVV